jgi:hypothetical protein
MGQHITTFNLKFTFDSCQPCILIIHSCSICPAPRSFGGGGGECTVAKVITVLCTPQTVIGITPCLEFIVLGLKDTGLIISNVPLTPIL